VPAVGRHHALISLAEREERLDFVIADAVVTLSQKLNDLSVLVSLVVWYGALLEINVVSRLRQSQNFDVSMSVELLEGCHEFLQE
jgi:hypothetical protein